MTTLPHQFKYTLTINTAGKVSWRITLCRQSGSEDSVYLRREVDSWVLGGTARPPPTPFIVNFTGGFWHFKGILPPGLPLISDPDSACADYLHENCEIGHYAHTSSNHGSLLAIRLDFCRSFLRRTSLTMSIRQGNEQICDSWAGMFFFFWYHCYGLLAFFSDMVSLQCFNTERVGVFRWVEMWRCARCCSHDFIGEFSTSYREMSRSQSQFHIYEVIFLSLSLSLSLSDTHPHTHIHRKSLVLPYL